MSYAVFHRDASGASQVEDAASLEDALGTVERLRNVPDVTDVRLFREVPVEVRTYYKVVVAEEEAREPVVAAPAVAGGSGPASDAPPGTFALRPPPVIEAPEPAEDVVEEAARRPSLFTRGG